MGAAALLKSLWARSGTKPELRRSSWTSLEVAVVATLPLLTIFSVFGLVLLRLVLTIMWQGGLLIRGWNLLLVTSLVGRVARRASVVR